MDIQTLISKQTETPAWQNRKAEVDNQQSEIHNINK